VVRPVARFRPAARRLGASLEPVYLVTRTITPGETAIDRVVEVYTGSSGKVAEFSPWQLGTAPVVSTEDPGFVSSTIEDLERFYSQFNGYGGSFEILDSGWSGVTSRSMMRMFDQVVDGVLYSTYLRGTWFIGEFFVDSQVVVDVLRDGYQSWDDLPTSVSYDVLTVSIDLETGATASKQAPLYSSALENVRVNVVAFGDASPVGRYIRTGVYTGIKEAIALTLPPAHPFDGCGAAAWSFLDNFTSFSIGEYTYTADTGYDNWPDLLDTQFSSTDYIAGQNVPDLDYFAISRQSFQARAALLNMAGFNSATSQRVLRGSGSVNEISTLAPIWSSCAGYSLLGRFVATSFADYSAEEVEDLETLLDLSGLPGVDQEGLVTTPTPPAAAPTGTVPAGSEAYTTTDPVFFMSSNYRPSFAGSPLISTYFTHYWIRG
jgi:hypothetical protein